MADASAAAEAADAVVAEGGAARAPLTPDEIDDVFQLLPSIGEALHQLLQLQGLPGSVEAQSKVAVATQALEDQMARADLLLEIIPGGDLSRRAQRHEELELLDVLSRKRAFLQSFALSSTAATQASKRQE
jgi:hypothetical protein